MKIQAADNVGFLALNVNKYVSDHDRCRLIIQRQCSICCNTRWGRVSETRLTRAFSEVASDAAIGCSSAPPPESTTLTLLHFYRYVIQARLIHRTFHLHVCVLHSCTVVAFTGATTMHVAVHMHMSVQPWHFHNAPGRAQIYCMEPCALGWTFTMHTHTVKERARRPDLVWLCSNVLRLDGCPACITLSNDTKMGKIRPSLLIICFSAELHSDTGHGRGRAGAHVSLNASACIWTSAPHLKSERICIIICEGSRPGASATLLPLGTRTFAVF